MNYFWRCFSQLKSSIFIPSLSRVANAFRSSTSFSRGCCRRRAHQRESRLVPLRVVVFKVFGSPPEISRWDPEKRDGRFRRWIYFRRENTRYVFSRRGERFRGETLFLRRWQRNDATHSEKHHILRRAEQTGGIKFRCHLLNVNKATRWKIYNAPSLRRIFAERRFSIRATWEQSRIFPPSIFSSSRFICAFLKRSPLAGINSTLLKSRRERDTLFARRDDCDGTRRRRIHEDLKINQMPRTLSGSPVKSSPYFRVVSWGDKWHGALISWILRSVNDERLSGCWILRDAPSRNLKVFP